jgi:hypothetical protein
METFWMAQPREVRIGSALADVVLPAFKSVMPTRIVIDDDPMREQLLYFQKRYPDDFARIHPHLDQVLAEWSAPALDLEKAWRRLSAELASFLAAGVPGGPEILEGGIPLGPVLSYDPARYFTCAETKTIAEFLAFDAARVRAAIDPDIVPTYDSVVAYYEEAAQARHAMLLAFG